MAGNRVHRFGTIFSRVEGLLRSGAISAESKPIWLDVYRTFPPNTEPKLFRPIPDQQIKDIVYPEDYIRARFHSEFGCVGLIDNMNQITRTYKSVSQNFINTYIEIARSDQSLTDDQLFDKTTDALIKEGIRLRGDDKQVWTQKSVRPSRQQKPSISEIALSVD